jgi:hypothetical protein
MVHQDLSAWRELTAWPAHSRHYIYTTGRAAPPGVISTVEGPPVRIPGLHAPIFKYNMVIHQAGSPGLSRQAESGATGQDKRRQDNKYNKTIRQDKTRQENETRQDKTRQDKTRQDKTKQYIATARPISCIATARPSSLIGTLYIKRLSSVQQEVFTHRHDRHQT